MYERSEGASPADRADEMAALDGALQLFVQAMRHELELRMLEGRRGWDDPANARRFYTDLLAHAAGVPLAAGQEANVANWAMFLWFLRTQRGLATLPPGASGGAS